MDRVPAYKASDETAAMFFELDYYGNPARGAVPAWKNEMAALSWFYWFMFDGLRAADHVRAPALFVHSDGCVFPDNVRSVHARVSGPKELAWFEGSQTDFYDQPAQVDFGVNAADTFSQEARMMDATNAAPCTAQRCPGFARERGGPATIGAMCARSSVG